MIQMESQSSWQFLFLQTTSQYFSEGNEPFWRTKPDGRCLAVRESGMTPPTCLVSVTSHEPETKKALANPNPSIV